MFGMLTKKRLRLAALNSAVAIAPLLAASSDRGGTGVSAVAASAEIFYRWLIDDSGDKRVELIKIAKSDGSAEPEKKKEV